MTRLDPGDPGNKYDTRESQRQLRRLLMAWDPIGVAGIPEAADEYDCLISPLMRQLHTGTEEADITRWLVSEVESHFGLTSHVDRERQFVAELANWWRQRSTDLHAE
jgi:hypothetical protein